MFRPKGTISDLGTVVTAVANQEQAAAWNGVEGDYWVIHEERYNAAVAGYQRRLAGAAAVQPGQRVLDIGCGCGESTRAAARAAAPGLVRGVDLSTAMLDRAERRARAEGLANVEFLVADAQVHPFVRGDVDLAISRFGAMFFADPVAAFANIGRALVPGGRLILLAWQSLRHNDWLVAIREALAAGRTLPDPPDGAPGPFGLARSDHARTALSRAGFTAIDITPVREPVRLGADPGDALRFLRGTGMLHALVQDLDPPAAAQALDRLAATLTVHHTDTGVMFDSAAWLITAQARRTPR
jgi:SAM-dependent methyltransferase